MLLLWANIWIKRDLKWHTVLENVRNIKQPNQPRLADMLQVKNGVIIAKFLLIMKEYHVHVVIGNWDVYLEVKRVKKNIKNR